MSPRKYNTHLFELKKLPQNYFRQKWQSDPTNQNHNNWQVMKKLPGRKISRKVQAIKQGKVSSKPTQMTQMVDLRGKHISTVTITIFCS